MATFDSVREIKALDALTPVAAQATDVNGIIVDTAGYEAVTFVVDVGAEVFTMNTSNFLDLIVQDGNDSGLSDAAVVPASAQIGAWDTPASGIFKRLDAAAEAPAVYAIGVKSAKRYLRLVFDFTGTVTGGIPLAAVALLMHARHQPAGATQTP